MKGKGEEGKRLRGEEGGREDRCSSSTLSPLNLFPSSPFFFVAVGGAAVVNKITGGLSGTEEQALLSTFRCVRDPTPLLSSSFSYKLSRLDVPAVYRRLTA